MNKSIATVLLALCFVSFTYAAGCTQQTFWNNTDYMNLVNKIRAEHVDDSKLMALDKYTANATVGFNSTQVVGILNLFGFSATKTSALTTMSQRYLVLGLVCQDVASILGAFTFSDDKVQMLRALINFTIDFQNNKTVIDAFSFSSDKDRALALFENSNPYSCVWGSLNVPRFDFIIDCSGSMDTTFTSPEGQLVTRLQYVKQQLYISIASIKPTQQFNLIAFSDRAVQWQPGVVFATPENIQRAYSWIATLRAGGGTYMLNAFQLAFSDPKVLAINFLSDGSPSDSSNNILGAVSAWSSAAFPNRPVNTISFQAGGSYDASAVVFMKRIAAVSGGVAKSIV